jgi:hypothetical protein
MTTTDNSRYLTILNRDKTDPPPIIRDLTHYNIQNDYIERKQLLFKGIEKILQNEENILMINEIFENKK